MSLLWGFEGEDAWDFASVWGRKGLEIVLGLKEEETNGGDSWVLREECWMVRVCLGKNALSWNPETPGMGWGKIDAGGKVTFRP